MFCPLPLDAAREKEQELVKIYGEGRDAVSAQVSNFGGFRCEVTIAQRKLAVNLFRISR